MELKRIESEIDEELNKGLNWLKSKIETENNKK